MIAHPVMHAAQWLRRARPLLGTLVEIGVWGETGAPEAFDVAFGTIASVQQCLSRFDPHSDIGRFNTAAAGAQFEVHAHTAAVLSAAAQLHGSSNGLFDASMGSAAAGWSLQDQRLTKHSGSTQLDLGGIAKGYAVDCAVRALQSCDVQGGWVNAGGDLRAFGRARLALQLRDEQCGGVRPIGHLADGALATSRYALDSRDRLYRRDVHAQRITAHVSVSAAQCIWADALTKVVAASGDAAHPLLARFGASAWLH